MSATPSPSYDNPAERAQREAEFAAIRERMRILYADMQSRREAARPKPPATTPRSIIAATLTPFALQFLN